MKQINQKQIYIASVKQSSQRCLLRADMLKKPWSKARSKSCLLMSLILTSDGRLFHMLQMSGSCADWNANCTSMTMSPWTANCSRAQAPMWSRHTQFHTVTDNATRTYTDWLSAGMQLCSAAICCHKVQHVTQLAVTLKPFLIDMHLTIQTMHIDCRITATAPTTITTITNLVSLFTSC